LDKTEFLLAFGKTILRSSRMGRSTHLRRSQVYAVHARLVADPSHRDRLLARKVFEDEMATNYKLCIDGIVPTVNSLSGKLGM
jgi:hypothetical protein